SHRYTAASVMLILVGLAIMAASPLTALQEMFANSRFEIRFQRLGACTVLFVLIAITIAQYGVPSPHRPRETLDRRFSAQTNDLLSQNCTHAIGSYWDVWPAVFHANLTLHDRGDPKTFWGIAHRCQPTKNEWMNVPPSEMRFGIVR